MVLTTILDEVAVLVDRPATLEDIDGSLVAFSPHGESCDPLRLETLLNRGVPEHTMKQLMAHLVYEAVESSSGLARIQPIPSIGMQLPRLALAIRHGDQTMAYMWILDPPSIMASDIESALIGIGYQLAHKLMGRSYAASLESIPAGALVADMIGGTQTETVILRRAESLGWQLEAPFRVVIVRGREEPLLPRELRMLQQITDVGTKQNRSALTTVMGDELLLIALGATALSTMEVAKALAVEATGHSVAVVIGLGAVHSSISHIARSYREARRALDLGVRLGSHANCFDYGALAPYEILSCMALCKTMKDFGRRPVERLMSHDASHDSCLTTTLEAMLDHWGQRKQAARLLVIHPNTLDYRLRKIKDVIGMNLDDPSTRFLLNLWIKALKSVHTVARHR